MALITTVGSTTTVFSNQSKSRIHLLISPTRIHQNICPFFSIFPCYWGLNMDEAAIARMRDSVQNLGSSTDGFGDLTLMRFLVARSMDSEKASKMFVEWRKWRAEMVPHNNHIPDSDVQDELRAEKVYLNGPSKKGHPIAIVKVCKHFPSKDQLQFKKFVVHFLDKTIASSFKGGKEIGNERLIGILDLDKISYKNVDVRGMITGFQFLQAYYPERLAKLYLLHMPGFFVRVWKLVSRFLDKATLEKVVIVTNEDERKEFVREVGVEGLPEEYGGQAKAVLIQHVSLLPLEANSFGNGTT